MAFVCDMIRGLNWSRWSVGNAVEAGNASCSTIVHRDLVGRTQFGD